MRNADCLHCPCQAYAGYFYVARALLINETSEMEEFTSSVREFCETQWTVVSSHRPTAQPSSRRRRVLASAPPPTYPVLLYGATAFITL